MQNTISSQEKSLEIAAKLSTLGELAGSLGHEIATPLTVISNSASKVKKHIGAMSLETPQRTDINKHFEKIERMVGRVEQIIKSIKNQVHSSDKELPVPVSVKEVISEVIVLTQSKAVKHGVEILVEPIDEKLQVMATEPELVQVLTNLVSNGIDAIRDSNKIRSNSDLLAVEVKSWIKIHAKENSDNLNELSIIVADSGSGVPAELQAKIFDSLFTTKKSGEGTGLGLSISKRLVKKHGGTLSLLPNNPGAQFEVRLKKAA
jgi:C4-dicarboxylate-specific signal transduction histidine kinase